MATSMPTVSSITLPASDSTQALQAPSETQRRPPRREGAVIWQTPAEQALEDAMQRSSPAPADSGGALGKRIRTDEDNGSEGGDTELDEPPQGTGPLLGTLSNVTAATLRYAAHKKLRADQRAEVTAYLQDSATGRQARMFVSLLALENKVDVFKLEVPPYQVSEELRTNINNYAMAVLVSVEISAYKGDIPRNHVLDVLKRFRFNLPVGIEHDLSNWEKVQGAVGYSLMQIRAKVKKLILHSIAENTNIFALSQLVVQGTLCRVTVQICARIALMRAVHTECSGNEKYWNLIDARLAFIRNVAGSDKAKTKKAFKNILEKDRETYGKGQDYEIGDQISNEWQQGVDDVVAGTVPRTSVQPHA